MPSGPPHLHEKFGDDGVAWAFLKERGFTHIKCVIQPKDNHELTNDELDAIDYLILEWDWDYNRIARAT